MSQSTLHNAKIAKQDEFYTRLSDIEKEMRYYRSFFDGKTVFCNCDDPFESNFFKYFAMNFNFLKLKKLICTCYAGSPISHTELDDLPLFEQGRQNEKMPYMIQINEVTDQNGDGAVDMTDIETLLRNDKNLLTILDGDGDFRSEESIAWLKEADVVVTNPPFSLFREFIAQLVKFDKKFISIGNKNAITYKEVFPLIKENKLWLGASIHSGGTWFRVPDYYNLSKNFKVDENGFKYVNIPGPRWFTNVDYPMRHEDLILYTKYDPEKNLKYDNYDAINVDSTKDIPCDYNGIMGVPITFLDKYNPEQFEILGLTTGRNEFSKEAWPTKRYENAIQHNPNGTITSGSKANTRATLVRTDTDGVYYTADNSDKELTITYARILIRRKSHEN